MKALAVLVAATAALTASPAAAASPDDYSGSDLWLRYERVGDWKRLAQYREAIRTVVVENAERDPVYRHTPNLRMEPGSSEKLVATTLEAARDELVRGLGGLLDRRVRVKDRLRHRIPDGAVVVGTRDSSKAVRRLVRKRDLAALGDDGYLVRSQKRGKRRCGRRCSRRRPTPPAASETSSTEPPRTTRTRRSSAWPTSATPTT